MEVNDNLSKMGMDEFVEKFELEGEYIMPSVCHARQMASHMDGRNRHLSVCQSYTDLNANL